MAAEKEPASEKEGRETEDNELRHSFRETWGRALDFIMACIGFSVGLGNVWRFPYLCYKNGGGAFLIPYFLSVIFGSIPMFYLEIALGQFMSKGGLQAWNLVPIFQGIGLASSIIAFYLDCYYNVIMTWAFYYFFASFTTKLPWQHCGHEWNSKNCSENFTSSVLNGTEKRHLLDPVTEFWENKVLSLSSGLSEIGTLKWDLTLCFIIMWILVYLCICNGVKSSGKVMYFTATSPYFFMIVLLIKNSMLEGAGEGVAYYLTPNFTKVLNTQVWVDAGTQVFFSSSIALGTLTALGSYNKFCYNSYRDSIIFAGVNSGTSILAGFIVFSILGFVARKQGKHISEVAESGPGLAFIAYPNAVVQMPFSPFWSACFFLMLLLLGVDSQFVGVEGVITTIVDQFPEFFRSRSRKTTFIAIACFVMFLIGLPMVCEGGMYVFQLFDYYSGSRIILLIAFFELVAISYVYGIRRFLDNVRMMIGDSCMRHTLGYLFICWSFVSPIYCLVIFILSAMQYTELIYVRSNGRVYEYPMWGVVIGWSIALSSAVWVPLVALFKLYRYGVSWKVFKLLLVPYNLHPHQMRPQDVGEMSLKQYEKEKARMWQAQKPGMNLSPYLVKGTFHAEDHLAERIAMLQTSAWIIGYRTSSRNFGESYLE